jgi:radical SAM superfamily enzyme YgiQ (UPF0313 family)
VGRLMPCYHRFFEESGHLLREWRLFRPNPTFGNPAWDDAPFRALIVRLSPHRDVDRSTAHLALAREVRRAAPGCWLDFAFLPVAADRAAFEGAGLPLLLGTQSHRSLDEFDLALASNACLPELLNLPALLLRSSIPVWARDRDERWPPLLLGGSNAAAAHALVAPDGSCMADALFFGEAEGELEAIVGSLASSRGRPKRERIVAAADRATGLWPAGDFGRTVRRAAADVALLDRQADPAPVLPGPEAATARLEISRGCPCRCSFCFEGLDRLPFRAVPAAVLVPVAARLRASTGASTVELSSLNFNTHPEIGALAPGLLEAWVRVNPMSQRVDILARTPELVGLELGVDKRTFTLGIEGISARLRRFLHKSLADADLEKAMAALSRPGIRELKLFYLITGTEEEVDFAELAEFLRWLNALRDRSEAQPRTVFSFGMLVRMPFTPLRHDPFPTSEEAWRRLVGRAKSTVETNGFEFRLAMRWLDWMFSQLLASGDHRLHGLLARMAAEGILWDGELPAGSRAVIAGWLAREGISFEELGREKPADYPFPMPQLAGTPSPELLWGRYLEAKERADRGYGRLRAQTAEQWRPSIGRGTERLAAGGGGLRAGVAGRVARPAAVPGRAGAFGPRGPRAPVVRRALRRPVVRHHPRGGDRPGARRAGPGSR